MIAPNRRQYETVQLRVGPFDEPDLARQAARCPEDFTPVVTEAGVLWFVNNEHLARLLETGEYKLVEPAG